MSILTIEDLEVRLGSRVVLKNVSVNIPEAGLVTILGRNGVGKTTLLRTVSGLYRPSGGRIRFEGRDIGGQDVHRLVRAGIAHAPEGRQLFGDMPVIENLRAGALSISAAEFSRRLDEVMALFPILAERRNQLAGSLSGGEQQMLCIGRALMAAPRLLLLDEPSLGLAPIVVKTIFSLFSTIRARGVAVVLVEQNAKLALDTAEYAYVLDQGKVVLEGQAGDLMTDERVVSAYLGE